VRHSQLNPALPEGVPFLGSLLTANQQVLFDPRVAGIARRLKVTPPQVIFRFAAQIGILPLTGTTNAQHMKEDLENGMLQLSGADVEMIFGIG